MARLGERIFVLVMLALFFVSSFGLTIFVIWQTHQNSGSSTTSSNNTSSQTPTTSSQPKLAGTKLSGFTPVTSVPSLKVTDLKVGTGSTAKAGETVTVDYTGAIAATGVIFQSTQDSGQPVTSSLSSFIEGWQIGIPGMKVGGVRQLLIPASLAYGSNPPAGSNIPANAALVFNVTLDKID